MDERTIEEYKAALAAANSIVLEQNIRIAELTKECNKFRTMLFTQELEPNGTFLAQMKIDLSAKPLETIMSGLEIHEAFARIHAEILHTKMSRDQIKEHVKAREEKKLKAAREYRETKNLSLDQKVERRQMSEAEAKKDKAVRSLAKALGKSYDEAKLMMEQMGKGKI